MEYTPISKQRVIRSMCLEILTNRCNLVHAMHSNPTWYSHYLLVKIRVPQVIRSKPLPPR